jgi:hypothetical protein
MMKEQKTDKKHLLLNPPFWLVAFLRAHINFQAETVVTVPVYTSIAGRKKDFLEYYLDLMLN